jgi:hypothetical protein
MTWLVLLPILPGNASRGQRAVRIEFSVPHARTFNLQLDANGALHVEPVSDRGYRPRFAASEHDLVGTLHYAAGDPFGTWFFLCAHPQVTLNGLAPPLSVSTLELGSLLTCGPHAWLVTHMWQAQPMAVPDSYRNETCPVCAAPLHLAPVVRCYCGRLLHLQPASSSDAPAEGEFDCFLKSGGCDCGMEATLEPQLLPKQAVRVLQETR